MAPAENSFHVDIWKAVVGRQGLSWHSLCISYWAVNLQDVGKSKSKYKIAKKMFYFFN